MSYTIKYSPEEVKRYPLVKKQRNYKIWIVLCLTFVAILCMRIYGIPDFLIPGDPDITKAAADVMLELIKEGETLGDAFTVFCEEVIHGAGI